MRQEKPESERGLCGERWMKHVGATYVIPYREKGANIVRDSLDRKDALLVDRADVLHCAIAGTQPSMGISCDRPQFRSDPAREQRVKGVVTVVFSTLQDQNPFAGPSTGVGEGCSSCTTTDHDDVKVLGHVLPASKHLIDHPGLYTGTAGSVVPIGLSNHSSGKRKSSRCPFAIARYVHGNSVQQPLL